MIEKGIWCRSIRKRIGISDINVGTSFRARFLFRANRNPGKICMRLTYAKSHNSIEVWPWPAVVVGLFVTFYGRRRVKCANGVARSMKAALIVGGPPIFRWEAAVSQPPGGYLEPDVRSIYCIRVDLKGVGGQFPGQLAACAGSLSERVPLGLPSTPNVAVEACSACGR